MSRQYESTSTSKNYIANTFDQFLNWQYNRSFMNCPRTIIEIDGGVQYYPDNIYIGERYFIGLQYFKGDHYGDYGEETLMRYKDPFAFYTFLGVGYEKNKVLGVEEKTQLLLEDEYGETITVLPQTTILSAKRLAQFQTENGFDIPKYLVDELDNIDIYIKCDGKESLTFLNKVLPFSMWRFIFDQILYLVLMLSLIILGFIAHTFWGLFILVSYVVISFFWYICTAETIKDVFKNKSK